MSGELSELDEEILALAATPPRQPGEMDNRIRKLGLGGTAFYARLNTLLDTEAALAAYPMVVNRLRRERDKPRTGRRAQR
jgi:hypothetical protein